VRRRLTGLALLALLVPVLASSAIAATTPKRTSAPRIALARTTTTVVVGSPIVVRGTVSAAHRSYTVLLQRRNGKTWTTVQTRRSSARGAFAFSLMAGAPATATAPFRIIAGTARHPLATSRVINVAIRAKPVTLVPPMTPASGGSVIATTVLPFGTLGVGYRAKLSNGDARPGAWAIASGALPPGITLAPTGLVSGTPVALGTSSFVVTFLDAATVPATQQLTISVYPPPVVTRISTGTNTTCALRIDRTVACWGGLGPDDLGTLAAGASGTLSTPVQVDDISDATDVSVGDVMGCALRATGVPVCWGGNNTHGALGNGTRQPARTPTAVVGIADAVAISAGASYGCALQRTGRVSCWGSNGLIGTLGDGTLDDSVVATSVVGITDATQISAGGGHACARRATGTISCWGSNASGELGNGVAGGISDVPVTVAGLTDAISVSAGENITCAVRATGTVACWGAGAHGALGNGSIASSSTPVGVSGLGDAVSVAVGTDGSAPGADGACAQRATGATVCWGAVGPGRDGSGTTLAVPVAASGLAGMTALALGSGDGCAISSGHPVCWGDDGYGEVGFPLGGPGFVSVPTPVRGV
jgi:alpha-tubulin suppressor-like RCC1 family protein